MPGLLPGLLATRFLTSSTAEVPPLLADTLTLSLGIQVFDRAKEDVRTSDFEVGIRPADRQERS